MERRLGFVDNGSSNGFTLIEIMVVLVIIGIVLTIGMTFFGGFAEQSRVRLAAEALQQTIEVSAEQAVLQSSVLGLSITANGYVLKRFQGGQWQTLSRDVISRPNAFEHRLKVEVRTASVIPSKTWPQLIMSPSGTMNEVSIILSDKNNAALSYHIQTNTSGMVSIASGSA